MNFNFPIINIAVFISLIALGAGNALKKEPGTHDVSNLKKALKPLHEALTYYRDCNELPYHNQKSGVYILRPGHDAFLPAYCNMDIDGGGWTVIQRRTAAREHVSFESSWEDYKWGFGRLDSEFWWGNRNIWLMTSSLDKTYELRVQMEGIDGNCKYAVYQDFRLSGEGDAFRIHIGKYHGNAGNDLLYHNGQRFSTKDRDHDRHSTSCAQKYKSGWWYKSCQTVNLNGPYLEAGEKEKWKGARVNWGASKSLKTVEMMIRPSKIIRKGWSKSFFKTCH